MKNSSTSHKIPDEVGILFYIGNCLCLDIDLRELTYLNVNAIFILCAYF